MTPLINNNLITRRRNKPQQTCEHSRCQQRWW